MRILFVGTVDFSFHCLEVVLENGGQVVGIVTSQNSRFHADFRDLTPIADRHGIPIRYSKNVNGQKTLAWIRARNPDVIFCWGWSQIIKPELLALPPLGIVGVHPALLPLNRGRHPLIWALVLGLEESGLTFFFMDEGVDSGPILSQRRFAITTDDTAATLYGKVEDLATEQIMEFLPGLISGDYSTRPQDDSQASYWRKRSPSDGAIDWRMNAKAIANLVRALTRPYPGATFAYGEQIIKVWKARICEESAPANVEPGRILKVEEGLPTVKCYDRAISLEELEPQVDFVEGDYLT